ncbi:MAG TPA: COX15/CtaA family protein [Steroidobacteraceae bacterium]|nr:COX15/CtaA family protein [Steroidobacteraceae bacterium]
MATNVRTRWFRRIALAAAVLAFGVVVLGAYVRLSDAGLGCPDWPTCYGHWTASGAATNTESVARNFPGHTVEYTKAIREMTHRYFAGGLGILIAALAVIALTNRKQRNLPVALPVFLLVFVILQGIFGALTVTLQLQPLIVTAHLLGGLTTLGLLVWLVTRPEFRSPTHAERRLGRWALAALAVLVVQLALGGWVSSNYAAVACPDFPTCQAQWWPSMDFRHGFAPWHPLGVDYTGGVLDHPARVAIHFAHRVGAVITAIVLVTLAFATLVAGKSPRLRFAALGVLAAVALQLVIGITMVMMTFPLSLAALHNAGAALLVISVVVLLKKLRPLSPTYFAGERRF